MLKSLVKSSFENDLMGGMVCVHVEILIVHDIWIQELLCEIYFSCLKYNLFVKIFVVLAITNLLMQLSNIEGYWKIVTSYGKRHHEG